MREAILTSWDQLIPDILAPRSMRREEGAGVNSRNQMAGNQ